MKHTRLTKSLLLSAMLPLAALAQTTVSTPGGAGYEPITPQAGTREFSIGANGATNKDLDDSFGGVAFSYGQYINETLLVALRQSVNYSNPNVGGTQWNGSTKIALDQHVMPRGMVRPFVGANFGRIYGDGVHDTWSAGLEAGAKFYVQERTFIAATIEYGWLFDDSDAINNRFDDGQWNWTIGVGFNF